MWVCSQESYKSLTGKFCILYRFLKWFNHNFYYCKCIYIFFLECNLWCNFCFYWNSMVTPAVGIIPSKYICFFFPTVWMYTSECATDLDVHLLKTEIWKIWGWLICERIWEYLYLTMYLCFELTKPCDNSTLVQFSFIYTANNTTQTHTKKRRNVRDVYVKEGSSMYQYY